MLFSHARKWVYPLSVDGRHQRMRRWTFLALHLVLFVTPWVKVGGHPALLFDRMLDSGPPPVFGGPVFPVAGMMPTLFRFNDKASAALVLGLCTLFDRTFYRGAAAFLVGAATYVLDDLGFDNRAASAIAI